MNFFSNSIITSFPATCPFVPFHFNFKNNFNKCQFAHFPRLLILIAVLSCFRTVSIIISLLKLNNNCIKATLCQIYFCLFIIRSYIEWKLCYPEKYNNKKNNLIFFIMILLQWFCSREQERSIKYYINVFWQNIILALK